MELQIPSPSVGFTQTLIRYNNEQLTLFLSPNMWIKTLKHKIQALFGLDGEKPIILRRNGTEVVSDSIRLRSSITRARNLRTPLEILVSVTNSTADEVNEFSAHYFPATKPTDKNIFVVGGTHGNEVLGIRGATAVAQLFRSLECPLISRIRRVTNVTVVPVLNSVGNKAGARCCPEAGQQLPLLVEGGHVIIAEHEKGSLQPPAGWVDPNRGWANNRSLAKLNLDRLFTGCSPASSLAIFNHDWSLPEPAVRLYAPPTEIPGLEDLLAFLAPPRMHSRKRVAIGSDADSDKLGWQLWHQTGLRNAIVETYVEQDRGVATHVTATMALMVNFLDISVSPEELLAIGLSAE